MTKVEKRCSKASAVCLDARWLATTPLPKGCHSDAVVQLDPLHFQSLFQFVQIHVSFTLYLAVFPTRSNQLDSNLDNLEATLHTGVFSDYSMQQVQD